MDHPASLGKVILDFIKQMEGCSLTPYVCPAGFWTVGYGHLCKPDQTPISQGEADALLELDFRKAQRSTLRICPSLSGDRLDAITDFTFNLGAGRLYSSTLRACINSGADSRVPTELRRWVHGGGRILPGLVARREFEVRLWLGAAVGGAKGAATLAKGTPV